MVSNDVVFVDIQLDVAGKAKLKEWHAKQDDTFDPVVLLLNAGYKVTINWDARNQCYSCFVVPALSNHANEGGILTARSNDWMKAIIGAYYRSEILQKGVWKFTRRKAGEAEDWDF